MSGSVLAPGVAPAVSVGELHDALARRLAGDLAPPARQEARDVIAAVLDVPRFWPTAHATHALTRAQCESIEAAAARLRSGMPFAYAVQSAAFRHLSLFVDERVLIPRPETEMIVDLVLDATAGGVGTAVDVGTGSGCIALALATEGRFNRVIGTDISADAIAVATDNHGRITRQRATAVAPVEFSVGSVLAPCVTRGVRANVVVSNPPYIAWGEAAALPSLVRDWEPPLALYADGDGLAAIHALAIEAAPVLVAGGVLVLEVDARRAGRARDIVDDVLTAARERAYRDVLIKPDLAGRARFVLARRTEA